MELSNIISGKKLFWLILAVAVLLTISAGSFFSYKLLATNKNNGVTKQQNQGTVITKAVDKNFNIKEHIDIIDAPVSEQTIKLESTSPDLLYLAFESEREYKIDPNSRIILIPHHLVAAREIANTLKKSPTANTIYLLMPDHFSQGKTCATISDSNWETFAGTINSNPKTVSHIASSSALFSIDNEVFMSEIAFDALAPYIAKAYGSGVRVIPITISSSCNPKQRSEISNIIIKELQNNPDSLLISTVDFSHYQPAEVADFHDVLASDVLLALADLETDKVELDSPNVLAITLKTARALKLGDVNIIDHTNSLILARAIVSQESTSHFFVAFSPGPIAKQEKLTLMFFGDTMLDRMVKMRTNKAKDDAYPFAKIIGAENRFMYGQDAIIANLEGPFTATRRAPDKGEVDFAFDPKMATMLKQVGINAVSQANNHTLDQGRAGADESRTALSAAGLISFGDQVHDDATSSLAIIESRGQKVALLGFNDTDNPLNKSQAETAIKSAYEQARYVVVFMHWGAEYQSKPNMTQIELAHWFIDNGVDAVIGGHPHWMQSVEVYKNRPIVYSLGNFIFDQDWSTETNYGLVAGLVLNPDSADLHLFPISITESQPSLLTGADRQARLDRLANISDPSLSSSIKNGVLRANSAN